MRVDDIDFPCSQTFRDYYHLIADDGDREWQSRRIEPKMMLPISEDNVLDFLRVKQEVKREITQETTAVINRLENKVNGLSKMSHTHNAKRRKDTY